MLLEHQLKGIPALRQCAGELGNAQRIALCSELSRLAD